MQPLRMAVVGVGHLGQAHARVLAGLDDVELVGVADVSAAQARQIADRHNTRAYTHYGPLLIGPTRHHRRPDVPPSATSRAVLERGIPLLIEKPIAPTVEQAEIWSSWLAARAPSCRSGTSSGSTRRSRCFAAGRSGPSS